eukprot:GEMP01135510.1.p1 GENE.GEMP01135510.1~~GEMP01135510.1.p1  ORF type:complete len:139 (+),score=41.79 GEMP01135510.1:71-487(+)
MAGPLESQAADQAGNADVPLSEIRDGMREFSRQRDWEQFHTPRNLMLALVGEVGELAELFQWRGEVAPGLPDFSAEDKTKVSDEMADVLAYLVRLADRCDVDLSEAWKNKMEKNRAKYPADMVRGSSKKYNEYKQADK